MYTSPSWLQQKNMSLETPKKNTHSEKKLCKKRTKTKKIHTVCTCCILHTR